MAAPDIAVSRTTAGVVGIRANDQAPGGFGLEAPQAILVQGLGGDDRGAVQDLSQALSSERYQDPPLAVDVGGNRQSSPIMNDLGDLHG